MIALLIYWEDDDLNVKPEVDDLREVLETTYRFKTDTVLIPSAKSVHLLLMKEVVECVEHWEGSDNLMIVYYAGHGVINDRRQTTFVW